MKTSTSTSPASPKNSANRIVSPSGLDFAAALVLIGGLSNPSKMPWYGWSISAHDCVTGGKLQAIEGSVCNGCYALKGFYNMGNVQSALARRKAGLGDSRFVEAFVLVLTTLYNKQKAEKKENRFRWHDSGDLQDREHLSKIVSICEQTPFLVFYLPTKEPAIVRDFIKSGGVIPDNLHIKVSVPMVGDTFKKQPHGLSFSAVGRDDDDKLFQCPALKEQGNKCLDCRACWSPGNINYPLH